MSDVQQNLVEQTANALTSAPATGGGLFAGWVAYTSQKDILFILSALVLTCQLVFWGYRFVKWLIRQFKK